MNILLPTDFSENSKDAAAYAMKLFQGKACVFHVFHVFPPSSKEVESQVATKFYGDFEGFVNWLNSKKNNAVHDFKYTFEHDHLIHAVREEVVKKNIDLIIMGTKGLSGEKNDFIGKNTMEVMTKVKCPVLAIPENSSFEKDLEILFPTDYKIDFRGKQMDFFLDLVKISKASLEILELSEAEKGFPQGQVENKTNLQDYFSSKKLSFQIVHIGKQGLTNVLGEERKSPEMIALVAKDLETCQKFLNGDQSRFVGKLPLLMLH